MEIDTDTTAANEPVLAAGTVLDAVPIFPLPNAVHFPNTLLPLHIFEPRYRQLIRHVMDGDRRMAMALLAPGWEPQYYGAPAVHPVMCLGEVISHQELPDGRSNVLLRGVTRISLMEEQRTGLEFRMVRACVEPTDPGRGDTLARHLAAVRQLFAHVIGQIPNLGLQDAEVLFHGDMAPALVLDAIASVAPGAPLQKQALLEERSVERRALLLADLLAEAATLAPGSAPLA